MPFALLVGADGADSSVRGALERKRPKITDFSVQRPLCLTSTYKFFDALPQVRLSAGPRLVWRTAHLSSWQAG